MKVGIIGARDRMCQQEVERYVDTLPIDTTVVSGGARGVDTWAEERALSRGMKVEKYKVTSRMTKGLSPEERAAVFYQNNERIVEACDRLVCFPYFPDQPELGGTGHAYKHAVQLGIPVEVY